MCSTCVKNIRGWDQSVSYVHNNYMRMNHGVFYVYKKIYADGIMVSSTCVKNYIQMESWCVLCVKKIYADKIMVSSTCEKKICADGIMVCSTCVNNIGGSIEWKSRAWFKYTSTVLKGLMICVLKIESWWLCE